MKAFTMPLPYFLRNTESHHRLLSSGKAVLVFLLLLVNAVINGQSPLKFNTYSTQDGLTQSSIIAIHQDDQGFMWFGTYGGLNRFDGYNFKHYQYSREKPQSISDNHVRTICQDTTGILWVGTTDGLNRFFPATEEFVTFKHDTSDKNSLAHNTIYKVLKDSDGDVWVGTWGGGLDLIERIDSNYSNEKDARYKFRHMLRFNDTANVYKDHISDLAEGQDGSIYVSAYCLYRIDKNTGKVTTYAHDPEDKNSLTSNNVSAVCVDKEGYVWAGTWEGGLNRIDPNTGEVMRFYHDPKDKYSLSHSVIMSLYCDDEGIVWVGTWGGGLNQIVAPGRKISASDEDERTDRYRFLSYQRNDNVITSISGNSIYSVYQDNTGTMWAGTDWAGVNRFNKEGTLFGHIMHRDNSKNSLVNNVIHALYVDAREKLWIGTQDGLNLYDPAKGKFTLFEQEEGNPSSISFNQVRTITADAKGNVWVGTLKGLNKYIPEENRFERYYINENDPGSTNNLSLHSSLDGTIWIGNYSGGLFRFNPETGKFKVYAHSETNPESISDNQVWAIAEDKEGMLWIGTGKGGLCLFNPEKEKFKCFKTNANDSLGLKSNTVWVLYFDHKDQLWIGTSSGINKLVKQPGESYSFENPFSDTRLENIGITGIVEDSENKLWITNALGLTCYNPEDSTLVHYGMEDGLQDDEFSINAIATDSVNNRIYAGGINGFNVFNPIEQLESSSAPVVKIVDLKLFNESVRVGEEINDRIILPQTICAMQAVNLSHKEYVITFEFAALHFKSPEGNQYAFMLEGFEDHWNYVGSQRSATYTNLEPGYYTFKVKAANSDQLWNEEGTSILLYVKPPYWKTLWFRIIAFFVLAGVLFAFYSLRVAQIKSQNLLLEKTVQERTKELNNKNQLLVNRTAELDKTNEKLSASILKLSELNSMKNKFFSIIGHDLRNPMNAIMGFAELLLRRRDGLPVEKRDDFVKHIFDTSRKTSKLLDNLLEWARSQSGNISFEPSLQNIRKIAANSIGLLKDQAGQKGIEIKLDREAPEVQAYCDERMIETVFRNLLSNAVKYTQPGGSVEVLFTKKDSVNLKVHIRDYGVGMDKTQLSNLFEIDKTVSTEGTTGETGTGLGLILCREFIERHGGEIYVDSTPGKGTEFTFTLPLNN